MLTSLNPPQGILIKEDMVLSVDHSYRTCILLPRYLKCRGVLVTSVHVPMVTIKHALIYFTLNKFFMSLLIHYTLYCLFVFTPLQN